MDLLSESYIRSLFRGSPSSPLMNQQVKYQRQFTWESLTLYMKQ